MTKTPLIFELAAATTAQQFTAELAKKTHVRLISQLQCEPPIMIVLIGGCSRQGTYVQ